MNIYICHNFDARLSLRPLVADLEAEGFFVTSRWIKEELHVLRSYASKGAVEDVEDMDSADVVVVFMEQFAEKPGRGKFFEFGYAYAKGKVVVLVGKDTGCVFHKLPEPIKIEDASGLLQGLKMLRENASTKQTRLGNTEAVALNNIAAEIHRLNHKWWVDIDTGQPKERNVGEMLMLAVSELAEALEGHRKDLMDDHLPHRKMFEVELADCVIRILDTAYGPGFDIGNALVEKCEYNAVRRDHQIDHRKAAGGKKY